MHHGWTKDRRRTSAYLKEPDSPNASYSLHLTLVYSGVRARTSTGDIPAYTGFLPATVSGLWYPQVVLFGTPVFTIHRTGAIHKVVSILLGLSYLLLCTSDLLYYSIFIPNATVLGIRYCTAEY